MSLTTWFKNGFRELTGTQTRFRRAAQPVIDRLGLEVITDEPDNLLVAVRHDGPRFVTLICVDDVTVRVSLMSRVTFPRGGVPPAAREVLDEANGGLAGCAFALIEGDETSRFCVRTHLSVPDLTPGTVTRLLDDLLPLVARLDDTLRRHGS